MALQVIHRLLTRAATVPHAEAVRELDESGRTCRVLTYAELGRAVLALAERIRERCGQGATVLISYPNQIEYVVGFFGVLAAEGVAFPLHPRLANEERVTAAKRGGASAILGTQDAVVALARIGIAELTMPALLQQRPQRLVHEQAIRHPARIEGSPSFLGAEDREILRCAQNDGDATSAGTQTEKQLGTQCGADRRLFLQSSGTTGPPKIVERGASALDAVARNVADGVQLGPNDRVLGLVPASHAYGVESVILGPIWAGASIHLCPHGSAALLPGREHEPAATVFPGVPALFEMFATVGDAPSSLLRGLRCAYSAGATLPRSVGEAFHARYGRRIGQLFGMTEVGSVTFNDPDGEDFGIGRCGLPMGGVAIRIVEPQSGRLDRLMPDGAEGEVAVATPSMMSGYLRDDAPICEPPATLRDGFFFTGDLGRLDACGRLTLTGRVKLIVDVGGLKVNLLEVEQALCQHAAVKECIVAPVAVSETVSRLKAYIIPRNGAAISPDELRAFLRPKLSAHKIPRTFEIRESFPRSASGKVLRHVIH